MCTRRGGIEWNAQVFGTVAIRIDGPRAASTTLSVLWDFTDTGERYWMELQRGPQPPPHSADPEPTSPDVGGRLYGSRYLADHAV